MIKVNKVKPIKNNDISKYILSLSKYGYKYVLLFMIGVDTGLRISDLRHIKYKDVMGKNTLKIKEQKTGKTNKVTISKELRDFIRPNLSYYGITKDDYICCGRYKNKAISRVQVYRVFRKAGEDIGMDSIGTHTMRKTYAVELYKKTENIELVQGKMNHKYKDTTLFSYILSGIDFDILKNLI